MTDSPTTPADLDHRSLTLVDPADAQPMTESHGLRIDLLLTRPAIDIRGISAALVHVPPGGSARAHQHQESDVIVVVTSGHALTLWGAELEHELPQLPGQFLHIPAPVPHAVVNLSADLPVVAMEFRADPEFSRDMHLLPHLQARVADRARLVGAGVRLATDAEDTRW